LQAMAQVPGVYSIQLDPTDGGLRGEMSDQINVNNHDASNQAFPGYQAWLASVGLDGSGVIVANVDSGVDNNHADLVNRFLSCLGTTCGGSASSTHGTHTAGIMAADGSSGVTDSYGFLRGLGMAPGANLVEQLYNPFFTYPDGMLLLMTDSYNNGADLSGNSWGPAGTPQGYDDDTMQVDIGVRDADPDTAGNQPLNYILSFMNGYGGYQTQGTPDEAKNIFTIGSTKMQTSGGAQILQIDDLSSNTAHGPALDGRTIPHMVAPGCYVDSTVPGSHSTLCGTSMASPHVSGAVALFIEYYRNLFGVDPSAALVKAAFLPVAHDLAGHQDANGGTLGHPFDSKQGWGRMDVEAVLDLQLPVLYFDNPVILDNTGETWAQTVSVADPSQPARLMLVWTDAYGHGLGGTTPAWNNDLDLVIETGGDTYLGNNFGSDGWSQPGGEADGKNNTEGVFLGPTAPGSVTIRVVASNISSDGIPNQGDSTDQDFALVCYNCISTADFTLAAQPDTFEVCAPDLVSGTIQVGQIMTYAHEVTLSVLDAPVGITASVSPTVVMPPGEATLTLDVGETTATGGYTLVVSGMAETNNMHVVQVHLEVTAGAPEAPLLVSPDDGELGLPYQAVTLDWEPLSEAGNYHLQVDTDPTFGSPVVAVDNIPVSSYALGAALQPATCYFWRTTGENGCGSGPWAVPFRFATEFLDVRFSDDLETGAASWSHQAVQGTDHWQLATAQSHSPTYAWFVPDDATTTDSRLWINTPIPVASASTLTFWHRHQFDSSYDGAVLEISTDGNAWIDLGPYITANGYNGTVSPCCGNPLAGRQAWVSDQVNWTQVQVDLDAFVGKDAQVRWRFGSDYTVGDVGWYIDDVQIGAPLPLLPSPTILAITPDHGLWDNQTPVTITGAFFQPTPVVMLGSTPLFSVTYASSTTLAAVVPAGLDAGIYHLAVINGDCQAGSLLDAYLACGLPWGLFSSDSPVSLGQPMHFAATVTGTGPLTYTWDFGDGVGTGTGASPVYTYTAPGNFVVSLMVDGPCGSQTITGSVTVNAPEHHIYLSLIWKQQPRP
jgi:serine protease AprX